VRFERFHGWIVCAVAAVVLLTRLGGTPLWDDDESKNAACTLAMLDTNDWVVPTFNGQLRIEKPPLVNWVQLAGIALCGRNETGVRIGSAVLTIGTCLMTWRIGAALFGPPTGLLAGIVMATCIWTAVGGRASTPDAPLVFCTTLALFLFVREARHPSADGRPLRLSLRTALGIGAACGAALLAKGPVGLVLPCAAFVVFAVCAGPRRSVFSRLAGIAGLRPLVIAAAALAIALPWYVAVTWRTDGEWLRGFLLVHNVGRFAAPMEGHAGSIFYYPAVLACGLFPWSMVLAVMAAHVGFVLADGRHPRHRACLLLASWAIAWVGAFSLAGTKLPGYVWPAYPALAIGIAACLDACGRRDLPFLRLVRDPARWLSRTLEAGWSMLAFGGIVIGIGLPLIARQFAPGCEWLGLIGVIPLAAACGAWHLAAAARLRQAVAVVAVAACAMTTLLATVGAEAFGRAAVPRRLFATDPGAAGVDLPPRGALAGFPSTPPSLVFYGGGNVPKLSDVDAVAAHLTARADSHLVVDSRFEAAVAAAIPPGFGIVSRVTTVASRSLVLIGPLPAEHSQTLAARSRPDSSTP
jgi:4-amino-4-deoxy-L-arabinose transferase-like glycosyltransferase